MDANLDKIALDLYGKIQTRFPDIKIGDEHGEVLSKKEDIPHARFFEFEYEEEGNPLGTIAITLDSDDGIVVQVSGDLVNDNENTTHHRAFKFIRSFRQFAKDRLLNFDVQNIGKSNMDKRDYEFQSKRKEEPMAQAPMMESKMFGTSRISYQDLGEARLIIKHSQPVNQELAAGRTMHIEGIYIENAQGERFRFPYKSLNGARALAEHIKAGGIPYDGIGKHIISLSEELAQLRKFKNYVGRQEQLSEAMGAITSKVMERIDSVKKEIMMLQRPAYYSQFAESFEDSEEQMIPETIKSEWIDRLTIRTFNEELTAVFPYIYKLVDETELPVRELNADDLFAEATDTVEKDADGKVKSWKHEGDWKKADTKKNPEGKVHNLAGQALKKTKALNPEESFESFVDSLIAEDYNEAGGGLLSPNMSVKQAAVEKLNDILQQELKGGPEGINAIESLKGIIDDPEFLQSLQQVDPDLDTRPLIQQYILANAPDVASQIHFGSEEEGGEDLPPAEPAPMPEPEPTADVAPEAEVAPTEAPPVPPAPVAEGSSKLKAKFIKAMESGATLDTVIDFGHRAVTLGEAMAECGMSTDMYQEEEAEDSGKSGVDEILQSIVGFWNREERNFTIGGTRVKTKVVKGFKDGEYPNASEDDVRKVLSMIEKKDPSTSEHNSVVRLSGAHGGQAPQQSAQQHPADMMKALLGKLGQ